MKNIIKKTLKALSWVISFLGIFSVNSACSILYGQEKEPQSLMRYKTVKTVKKISK